MINQQGAHLPPVTHLFDHYASNRLAIPVGGCAFEQMPLLLHAGELGVALIDNQINQSVAHLLRRHLAQVLPFAAPLKGAELDFLGFDRAIEGVELEAGDFVAIDADLLAPVVKHPNPITKRSDFGNLAWHKIRSLLCHPEAICLSSPGDLGAPRQCLSVFREGYNSRVWRASL